MNQQDQTSILAVYDLERIFEAAIAAVFTGFGITCATPDTISKFQSERPRAEIIFKAGSGIPKGSGGAVTQIAGFSSQDGALPQSLLVHAAYKGEAYVTIVTNASEDDKQIHAALRANTRFLMDTLAPRINGTYLTNHRVHFVQPTGTSLVFSNKEGFWTSNLQFSIDFSIQPAVFQTLANINQTPQ